MKLMKLIVKCEVHCNRSCLMPPPMLHFFTNIRAINAAVTQSTAAISAH